jgi:hypothetical protein
LPGGSIELAWNDFRKPLEKDVVPELDHAGRYGGSRNPNPKRPAARNLVRTPNGNSPRNHDLIELGRGPLARLDFDHHGHRSSLISFFEDCMIQNYNQQPVLSKLDLITRAAPFFLNAIA